MSWRPRSEAAWLRAVNTTLRRLREIDSPYGARYDGLPPLRDLTELARLPLTSRDDLEASGPLGACVVKRDQLARIHASSGSRGAPLLVGYTKSDLNTVAELVARALRLAGVGARDIYQNAKSYGLFTGGLAFHEAATRIGATVVPTSIGRTARQLELLELLGVTALGILPSYGIRLADAAAERGLDLRRLPVRVLMLGAEMLTEPMRLELEERFAARAFNGYGLAELGGPGVAAECAHRTGMHIWEDHFLFETIDPVTGSPVDDGEVGELVLSAPTRQAFPLLRYRTRDLVRCTREPCACGGTTARILEVVGRDDDMLNVSGVCVFPAEVERLLLSSGLTGSEWFLEVDDSDQAEGGRPVVWAEEATPLDVAERNRRIEQLTRLLREGLGVRLPVRLVPHGHLPRSDGKARRLRTTTGLNGISLARNALSEGAGQ